MHVQNEFQFTNSLLDYSYSIYYILILMTTLSFLGILIGSSRSTSYAFISVSLYFKYEYFIYSFEDIKLIWSNLRCYFKIIWS